MMLLAMSLICSRSFPPLALDWLGLAGDQTQVLLDVVGRGGRPSLQCDAGLHAIHPLRCANFGCGLPSCLSFRLVLSCLVLLPLSALYTPHCRLKTVGAVPYLLPPPSKRGGDSSRGAQFKRVARGAVPLALQGCRFPLSAVAPCSPRFFDSLLVYLLAPIPPPSSTPYVHNLLALPVGSLNSSIHPRIYRRHCNLHSFSQKNTTPIRLILSIFSISFSQYSPSPKSHHHQPLPSPEHTLSSFLHKHISLMIFAWPRSISWTR